MEVDTGVTGAFMAMMLVNIGVMCSAGRNGKHIRWRINLITERKLEDNLVESATSSDAWHPITSVTCCVVLLCCNVCATMNEIQFATVIYSMIHDKTTL